MSGSRDRDWTLTAESDDSRDLFPYGGTIYPALVRYRLDGLWVTPDQAQALIERGRNDYGALRWQQGPDRCLLVNGIWLSPREAAAISAGTDPLAVLLPGSLAVRVLTPGELTE
jgi:hypothetical protein